MHFYAPGVGRTVALTFDDGPGASTAQILSILMRAGVRATFFNLGYKTAALPSLVRTESVQGQTIGIHTWDHANLPSLSAAAQAREIDRATAEQVQVLGSSPCLFRPPYGNYTDTTLTLAAARNLSVWDWSVDTEDWKARGSASAYWVQRITARAEAGVAQLHPVILFHNGAGAPATAAALPAVIGFYRARGYAFVDLLGHRGFAPYAPTGMPAPAMAMTTAGLHLFTRTTGGHIRERTRHNGAWSTGAYLGGSTTNGPAAARVSSRAALIAILDTTHHIDVRTVPDTGSLGTWTRLPGTFDGRPAVTANPRTGTVTIVARDNSGAIQYQQRVAGTWGPVTSLGGQFVTAPAIVRTAGNGLTVAAVSAAGALWTRHRGSGWGPWRRLGGLVATADPALTTTSDGQHLLLMARNPSGGIMTRVGSLDAGGWTSWHSLGGIAGSGPTATAVGASLYVAVTGTDGTIDLDVASAGATASGWTGWRNLPG